MNNMITLKDSIKVWKEKIEALMDKSRQIKDNPLDDTFDEIGRDIEVVLYPINSAIITVEPKEKVKYQQWTVEFQFARVIRIKKEYYDSRPTGIYKRELTRFLLEKGEQFYNAIPKDNPKKQLCKDILKLIEPLRKLLGNDIQHFVYLKKVDFSYTTNMDDYKAGKKEVAQINWNMNNSVKFSDKKDGNTDTVRIDWSLTNIYIIQQIYPHIDEYLDEVIEFQKKLLSVAIIVRDELRKTYIGQIMAKAI